MLTGVVLCALAACQDLPELKVGEESRGVIDEKTAVLGSAALARRFGDGAIRRARYQLRVEQGGEHVIQLFAESFTAWLAVREEGRIVAEGVATAGKVSFIRELTRGRMYTIEVCALQNGSGEFKLRCAKASERDRTEARIAALRAELAAKEELGPEHPETGRAVNDLALALSHVGMYSEAEPLCRRALAISEKALGGEHASTAACLNNLASLLKKQGRLVEAEPLFRRAFAICEKTLGAEHASTATSLTNLASLLELQGNLAEAELLCRRAFAIFEKALGGDHVGTAASLTNLASLLKRRGNLAEAERLYRRALVICESSLGGEHPDTATSLSNLAVLLHDQGRHAEAEPLFRRALAICEKALGDKHASVAGILNNLASLLKDEGKLDEAESVYRRALAVCELALGSEHIRTATSLDGLALLLKDQRDLAEAESLCRRALAIWEKAVGLEHAQTAVSLHNLASILADQRNLPEAERLYRRSLAVREKVLGGDDVDTAAGLHNLAWLVGEQGKLPEAERISRRALSIWEKALGLEHPNTAASLDHLFHVLGNLGAGDTWLQALRLADARLGYTAAELPLTPTDDRFLLSARVEDAIDHLLSAAALVGQEDSGDLFVRLTAWKGLVFRTVLRSRNRLLTELTSSQRELATRIQHCKAQLSNLAYAREVKDRRPHAKQLMELQEEKRQIEAELLHGLGLDRQSSQLTVADLAALLPRDAAFIDLSVLATCRFAKIVNGEVIERARWEERRAHAWIVHAGETAVRHVDLGSAQELERMVSPFLEELEAPRGESLVTSERGPSRNDRLRSCLWEPLAKELGGRKLVFICPDRFLARVPLETIQLGDGRFLIEERQFVYTDDPVTLGGLLRGGSPNRAEKPSLLCVGGVDYESRATGVVVTSMVIPDALRGGFGRKWKPLSQTRPEIESIAAQLRKSFGRDASALLLTEDHALEERVKTECGRFSILHLATHGYFEPTGVPSLWEEARKAVKESEGKPQLLGRDDAKKQLHGYPPGLLSGLVLAGANQKPEPGRDDGYLTAEEVDALPLKSCDLVVLSACETGLGTTRGGEGMMSVRRAFREAGAKTVISSLWRVPDESTRKLMGELYRRMWEEGASPAKALRDAQLWLLAENRRRDARSPRPSTWGAFVLSGEWR